MNNDIIKDQNLREDYEAFGYAKVPGINNEMLKASADLFHDFFKDDLENMFISHFESSFEINLKISNSLFEIYEPWLRNIFYDYKFVLSHFIVKSNLNSKEFTLHQDWSVVNEKEFPFIHLWIPFQDTDDKNGGMYVLPHSHKILGNLRSESLGIPFIPVGSDLEPFIKKLKINKGVALLYSPALFHGSLANISNSVRMTVLIAITHKNAPLHYYHKNNNGKLDVYSINSNDLLNDLKELASGEPPRSFKIKADEQITGIANSEFTSEQLLKFLK